MLRRKLMNIKDTEAPIVAMDCPGCVMQIKGGLDKQSLHISVLRTAELLATQFK
jgi:Fe-S oxidoreductase